nr:hypothetical protein [Kitasatospora sp. MAA19]
MHDEIVLELAPGERERVEVIVREQMAGTYPLDVSVGVGANWEAAAP